MTQEALGMVETRGLTSPRTITVTSPDPIFSVPTSATLAALHIWSAASIAAVSPLVSTIHKASCVMIVSSLWINEN